MKIGLLRWNPLVIGVVAVATVASAALVWTNQTPADVLEVDLSHNHFRATMTAEWRSYATTNSVITEFVDSSFSLKVRDGCGLDDGPRFPCSAWSGNKVTVDDSCDPPYENRCFVGVGTLVIETEPGYVNDPTQDQEAAPKTLYFACHYGSGPDCPFAWMPAGDGTAKVTLESDFIALYGDYVVTFYPYKAEWKKSPWGETVNWYTSGPPLVHRITVREP